ncbi:RNA polymerase RpoE-like sigma-24 subunit [Williamsia muralis]|uniref:RNA polymerase RpoE-like sigma-24 subunit n=1 Tax=Williamsia marianensis TaxID=85044 RepID=A0A315S0H4_WILMA|nr:RNA polymerase RpoE-like sigma-24 subunit [Williamsia marianensis]RKR96944.1 RNA polymerase RpoE-like sigma-24 subunit [Williamsia muralis]
MSGTAGSTSNRPDGGPPSAGRTLLDLYDEALPAVYGYLLRRTRDTSVAEDLTSETFLAAMDNARGVDASEPSIPWLIGVARHKLADHWRRMQRTPTPVDEVRDDPADDEWDVHLDRLVAEYTLAQLSTTHRAVLTLRYVDDCTVGQCAELLGRTVAATEALLTRAKRAFRTAYPDTNDPSPTSLRPRGGRS